MHWSLITGRKSHHSRAQQPVDNLQLASLAVAIVAQLGEFAAAALHVARGHVAGDKRAVVQVPPGERRFDRGLALREPVERAVELVLVDRAQAYELAEARGGGLGRKGLGGGELGGGL